MEMFVKDHVEAVGSQLKASQALRQSKPTAAWSQRWTRTQSPQGAGMGINLWVLPLLLPQLLLQAAVDAGHSECVKSSWVLQKLQASCGSWVRVAQAASWTTLGRRCARRRRPSPTARAKLSSSSGRAAAPPAAAAASPTPCSGGTQRLRTHPWATQVRPWATQVHEPMGGCTHGLHRCTGGRVLLLQVVVLLLLWQRRRRRLFRRGAALARGLPVCSACRPANYHLAAFAEEASGHGSLV